MRCQVRPRFCGGELHFVCLPLLPHPVSPVSRRESWLPYGCVLSRPNPARKTPRSVRAQQTTLAPWRIQIRSYRASGLHVSVIYSGPKKYVRYEFGAAILNVDLVTDALHAVANHNLPWVTRN